MKTQFSLIPFLIVGGLAMAAAQEIPQRLSSLSHESKSGLWASQDHVVMGDVLYYMRKTVTHGYELWQTDGTAEGTRLVTETIPGTNSRLSSVGRVIGGNHLYFTTYGGDYGEVTNLWKTDGTAAGTVPVFTPSPGGLRISGAQAVAPAPGGGVLLITYSNDPWNPSEATRLWKSDGTETGTVLLGAGYKVASVQTAGDTIWFGGSRLWKSNGTEAGTVTYDPPLVESLVTVLWAMRDDAALFTSTRGGKQMLQRVDASGVTPLKETGEVVSATNQPVLLGGAVHFMTHGLTSNQLQRNYQLWRSDGTAEGTTQVKALPGRIGSTPLELIPAGGRIYFHAAAQEDSPLHLWVSDGTEEGTLPLMQTNFGSPRVLGNKLYFLHALIDQNPELWSTDGTMEGTRKVAALGPSSGQSVIRMVATPSRLIIAVDRTIWTSDGTTEGTSATHVVESLEGQLIGGISAVAEGQVMFSAHEATSGRYVWKSDGTAGGTVRVGGGQADPHYASKQIGVPSAATMDGVYYFVRNDGIHDGELWRSDGTAAGTWMVKDSGHGTAASAPESLTVFKGEVWFTAKLASGTRGLWRTDGTAGGTRVATEVGGGGGGGTTRIFSNVDGCLHVNFSGSASMGLWRTDGTAESTVRLVQHGSDVTGVLEYGGRTYYTVGDSVWRTDGTPAGTEMLHKFNFPVHLASAGGNLLVLEGIPGTTTEMAGLWRMSEGAAPEKLLSFASISSYVVSGGVLHFGVKFPAAEAGLWRSDGTLEGTYLLREMDIRSNIVPHHGRLYFCANDGVHGEEPWVSDGTAEGTRMLADLTGDSGGSSPSHFTPAGGKVFFAATTETEGPQLYVVDAAGVPTRYDQWLDAHRAEMNGRLGRGEDADDDGYTNLQEFAFGGDPADGAVRPHLSSGLVPSPGGGGDGEKHLSLTLPVRRGTVFVRGRPATGAADGVIYRILATEDLADPAEGSGLLEVLEDTSFPHPPHPDEDYEYRTFRLDDPVAAREKAFLRVVTE